MSFSKRRECTTKVQTDGIPTETNVSQVSDHGGGDEETDKHSGNVCSVVDYFIGISPSKMDNTFM